MDKSVGLETMAAQIKQADTMELEAIMQLIEAQYRERFPDWEVHYLALPKNDQKQRKRILDWIAENVKA
ncbi:MAG: hypothetical protein Q4F17_00070 [Eubacteriales bacterium]|nr:hypothetical protein [Eubacteriales bacterium]